MTKYLLVAILIFSGIKVQAQLTIKGKVVNEVYAATISVSIVLKSNEESFRKISDSSGNYQFNNLKQGKYTLTFTSVGWIERQFSLELQKDTVLNIELKPLVNALGVVTINHKKPLLEKKNDRIVFNAEMSTASVGTDALELLSKVPGVRVNNERIALIGKGGVSIMLNDKLIQLSQGDLSNYLKSIASDRISKIEIITNPPAKYDAQGNNGIINIVLKKTLDASFKGSINSTFTQATYATMAGGITLNYRKDKLLLYSNLNIRKGSTVPLENTIVNYPNQTWDLLNKDRNFRTVPAAQAGVDYVISSKASLGINYNGGTTNFHSEENIKTFIYNKLNNIDSIINSDGNARINSQYNAVNMFFKQAFKGTGKQITFDADWFQFKDNKARFFDNHTYLNNGNLSNPTTEFLSTSNQEIHLYTFKSDVELPNPLFKLAFGTKLSFIENISDLSFLKKANEQYEVINNQTDVFDYKENTQAAYINLQKSNKNWDFQLGFRTEYTQTLGKSILNNTNIKNNYFQIFPTLYASFRENQNHVFSIAYGRRINRPSYRQLNPFRWYSNAYVYAQGNPFLQPSYNNNIELSHVYAQRFTTLFSFSETRKGYSDVNFVSTGINLQYSMPLNFFRGYQYQLSNSIALNPFKWLTSTNQFSAYYVHSKSEISNLSPILKTTSAYLSTSNQLVFNKNKTVLGDLNFWYNFPTVEAFNKIKANYNLDIGMRTLFLEKKLQFALNITDIFKSDKQQYSSRVNAIFQQYNNYYDSRAIRISARYNFGNQKVKVENRKPGNEDERKRNN